MTNSKIMNQLSYKVSSKKIQKIGLNLFSNFEKEIKQTLKLFN